MEWLGSNIGKFFADWNTADWTAIIISISGLAATFYMAASARTAAQTTRQEVGQAVNRIGKMVSTFELVKYVRDTMAMIADLDQQLALSEWTDFQSKAGGIRSNFQLIADDDAPCLVDFRTEITKTVAYYNRKISSIITQTDSGHITESAQRLKDVLAKHSTLLTRIQRSIEKEQLNEPA